jgi:hypothetical protein
VDADDVGVIQLGSSPGFAKEQLALGFVELIFAGQFDRDGSIELRVASLSDVP